MVETFTTGEDSFICENMNTFIRREKRNVENVALAIVKSH